MKLAIMQPYFFPYLGYYALIKATEKWVVFDTAQYIRKGWVNRNRICSPAKEKIAYITVPVVKAPRETMLKDATIDVRQNWEERILGQLAYYRKKAPFYNRVIDVVKEVLFCKKNKISELNVFALKTTCEYLEIPFDYSIFSEDTMNINSVNAPDEWSLEISKNMKATSYYNPPGGVSFFDKSKFQVARIDLEFLSINLNAYECIENPFIPGLSIIDVMMFNNIKEINSMLNDYELL
jgi:hypothetical protein